MSYFSNVDGIDLAGYCSIFTTEGFYKEYKKKSVKSMCQKYKLNLKINFSINFQNRQKR